jgi:hypothetical protein
MKRFLSFFNQPFEAEFLSLSLLAVLFLSACSSSRNATTGGGGAREYLAIRVYHAADESQLGAIDNYLQSSLVPAFDREGFNRVGVFRAIDNDTAKDKRMYVFIPFRSMPQLEQMTAVTDRSLGDSATAPAYTKAAYNKAPFTRFETILLREFEGMPVVKASGVKGDISQRVYELRSYESATEALHKNKVQMFNSGEVTLFERLGFNAVFYGQVVAGSRMPNLMYMTSFDNKAIRDEHWKAFGSDPEWKKMSSDPIYQNNVSHIDITFLRPTAYSRL